MTPQTRKTTSKDGTGIAFDLIGHGPPLILVLGAFNDRRSGAALASFLAPHFSVLGYDRRGRGESGDAATYAIEREIEDLDALIRSVGGSAAVLGYSSGAVLALRATAAGLPITRVALYDTPPPQAAEHAGALASLIAGGRRGDAVEYFQRRVVGIPEPIVVQLRHAPFRPALEAMAHTLVYEAAIMDYSAATPAFAATVRQPVLAIAGGSGAPFMRDVAATLARSLPDARALTLDGATHDIDPTSLGPVVARFLGAQASA